VGPSGKFLYAVGNTTQFTTSIFAIDSASGALTPIAGSPFLSPIQSDAFYIAIHPSGKFLYSGLPFANDIDAWSVNSSTGMLTLVPNSPFVPGTGISGLTFTPSGSFLYAINSDDGTVSCFAVDAASGDLTAVNSSPFRLSAGTGSLTIDPSGQFLYAANSAVNVNMIAGFSINAATGALTNFSSFAVEPPILLTIVKFSP
jgi:6-phosphogluconolactonase (cycloisomerase 2 family)